MAGGAYRRVVLPEHGGPGGGDPGVIAARLVPVAQFLGDLCEFEGEREHRRIGVLPAPLARGERLLQQSAGGERVVGLPVQPGQQVRGVQHLGVVLAVRRAGGSDGLREQLPGGAEVARGAQGEGPVLGGCQRRGMGHVAMLPSEGRRTLPGHAFGGVSVSPREAV
ncbi:hypothetical protein SAMN04489832_0073 [Micromonospora cremea]|uniref:Uncharacterized protein n=1 Tax=Micromonospora cremea TaxID=709881 RepID=A0A1N5TBV9_9ACTN|nr:hypothetical protein SAMN04489832_0073 [Micromonospora cremea]